MKLDALDKRILFELDVNSRQSMSELSRKVKHGRDIVEYRVQRLIKENVIQRFTASVNPYALGKTIYKSYLKLRNDKEKISKLLVTLKKTNEIYCYTMCDGAYDLIFTVLASTPFEYSEIESKLLTKYKDLILSHSLGVIVSYTCYPRRYLLKEVAHKGTVIGGQPKQAVMDPVDRVLLSELCANSRVNLSELSKRAAISNPTVISRLSKLEKDEVIAGYRVDINSQVIGFSSYKAQLELFSMDSAALNKIKTVCDKIPWVMKLIVQLGSPRVECNIDARDHMHFNNIISELKEALPDVIQSVSTVMINKEEIFGVREEESLYYMSPAA